MKNSTQYVVPRQNWERVWNQ